MHRDVKPGNLLVRPNGTLVLTDFGIARSALVGQLTAAGSVLGTASYISPEQAIRRRSPPPPSDVYALGVVAYQCLSGRRPFEGDNPLEIAMQHVRETPPPLPGDIPPAVRAIVERAHGQGARPQRGPTRRRVGGRRPAGRGRRWPTATRQPAAGRLGARPQPAARCRTPAGSGVRSPAAGAAARRARPVRPPVRRRPAGGHARGAAAGAAQRPPSGSRRCRRCRSAVAPPPASGGDPARRPGAAIPISAGLVLGDLLGRAGALGCCGSSPAARAGQSRRHGPVHRGRPHGAWPTASRPPASYRLMAAG